MIKHVHGLNILNVSNRIVCSLNASGDCSFNIARNGPYRGTKGYNHILMSYSSEYPPYGRNMDIFFVGKTVAQRDHHEVKPLFIMICCIICIIMMATEFRESGISRDESFGFVDKLITLRYVTVSFTIALDYSHRYPANYP